MFPVRIYSVERRKKSIACEGVSKLSAGSEGIQGL